MDNTALTLCMDNEIPIIVFDMNEPGNIRRVVHGRADRHAGRRGRASARPSSNASEETAMMLDDVYKDTESKMSKAIEATRTDFASIRTGRASPALLDRLHGRSLRLAGAAQTGRERQRRPTAVRC